MDIQRMLEILKDSPEGIMKCEKNLKISKAELMHGIYPVNYYCWQIAQELARKMMESGIIRFVRTETDDDVCLHGEVIVIDERVFEMSYQLGKMTLKKGE